MKNQKKNYLKNASNCNYLQELQVELQLAKFQQFKLQLAKFQQFNLQLAKFQQLLAVTWTTSLHWYIGEIKTQDSETRSADLNFM